MQNETVEEQIQYAGVLTRIFGAVVDIYIFQLLLTGVISVVESSMLNILNLLLFMFTFGLVPFLLGGTLGQKLFGMSLVDHSNKKVKLWRTLLRALLLLSAFWWFSYVIYHWEEYVDTTTYIEIILPFVIALIPLITTFFNSKRQTLFDLFSGTYVIVSKRVMVTPEGDRQPKRSILEWGRLFLKLLIVGFLAYIFYIFGAFLLIYGTMSLNHKKAYNQSFHQIYTPNDYNDSAIRFYVKELEAPSKAFVEAEGMYEIFAYDVKRDLSGNCISYFLRQHEEDDWINMEGKFKKNARNRYANTKESIKRTKKNEDYLGKHFYDYDLNDVNEIKSSIANIWGDKNANEQTCQNLLGVNEMYQQFIMLYIENREASLLEDQKALQRAKPNGVLNRKFYQNTIEKAVHWLKILHAKHPEYQEYKIRQKDLRKIQKKKALWRSAREGKLYSKGFFAGVNANIFDENGTTPLMAAALTGTLKKIERTFLEADVNFRLKNKKGLNAFALVSKEIYVSKNREQIYDFPKLRVLEVKNIIGSKAKIVGYTYDKINDKLTIVINKGTCKYFDLPLRTTCGVQAKKIAKKSTKWDPIFGAIYNKNNKELERLLSKGGHVNVKNGYDNSPVFYSIPKNPYALKRLIESGADMYEIYKFGNATPLLYAVRAGSIESVKVLLDLGMDVNFKHPKRGDRALDVAIIPCKNEEMITLLIKHGAKFSVIDEIKLKRHCKGVPYWNTLVELLEKKSI